MWWIGPDSDQQPSASQADVLIRLDDGPRVVIFLGSEGIERGEVKTVVGQESARSRGEPFKWTDVGVSSFLNH